MGDILDKGARQSSRQSFNEAFLSLATQIEGKEVDF